MITDILITDVTNKTSTSDGTGSFDLLMEAVNVHLNTQFAKKRITGNDYATVYLGAMQTVLQQAIAFTLGEGSAEKQVDLLSQQVIQAEEQTDLIIAQTAAAYENIKASEADTIRRNIINNKEVLKLQKETTKIEKETDELVANGVEDRIKTQEEVDLLESQDLEVLAATLRNDSISEQQILKLAEEVSLLSKKILTEDAQTTNATGGIMLAQLELTQRQTEAFKGKHLNAALKLQLDAWATAYAINDGDLPSLPNFMVDLNANSQLTTLDALITESEDFMDTP